MTDDTKYMEQALALAAEAAEAGEVPVGAAVADKNGDIIAFGRNTSEAQQLFAGHAEMNALAAACKYTGRTKLYGCTLYTTLEPCPMCMGACVAAGIKRTVFGAYDRKNGAAVSAARIADCGYTHIPDICGGVLEDKCSELLTGFFGKMRKGKKSVDIIDADSEARLKRVCSMLSMTENDIRESLDEKTFYKIIRKNGKPAGVIILKNGAADIRIAKEYAAYVTVREVQNAMMEADLN